MEKEKPVRIPVRKFSSVDENTISQKVEELQAAGVIEPSFSSWRCMPVIVNKKDDGKRMTINYKPVNNQTVFDAFPLPVIEELIPKLSKAVVFSKLDFSQFYHRIPLVSSDREKTAFFACGKLWEYTRVPFSLKNAAAACSRIMNNIFSNIKNCVVYLDDILIFGANREDHDKALFQVFEKIRYHNLSLNPKKCSFCESSIDFLGFKASDGKVMPTEERITSVNNFPLPGDLKSLERFIGMSTYFGKFVQHFSSLISPLQAKKRSLLEGNTRKANPSIEFYTDIEKESFEGIKSELSSVVLTIPSDDDELILRTDASGTCLAAVLMTSDGKPVSFLSRVLTQAEKNYDIVEREALAIYWGIKRCKLFLLGRRFKVYSDH